jgi:hypothetical protein
MTMINPIGGNTENPLLPAGRIVGGHPMVRTPVKDDTTKQQKLGKDNQPRFETYIGFAIPKAGEQHWSQTAWGQLIYNEGVKGFPRGEHGAPTFAWKIVDGDSTIPNRSGTIPSQQEGYAGHWVLNLKTELTPPKCYKANAQFGTLTELTSDKELKKGDYGRMSISVAPNCDAQGNAKTPGVYLNPLAFCLDREGEAIVGEFGVDANAAFGGTVSAPVAAYTPPVQQAAPAPYVAPIAPNTTYMAPPPPAADQTPPPPAPAPEQERVLSNGFTATQLRNAGWPETAIAALG